VKELTRVQQINIAVAKVCEWTDIRQVYSLWDEMPIGYHGHPPNAKSRDVFDTIPVPDYYHSLDAAVAAAGEAIKAPYHLHIYIKYEKGIPFGDVSLCTRSDEVWHKSTNTTEAIAAAICEAILQAHGVTVASEPESEVGE